MVARVGRTEDENVVIARRPGEERGGGSEKGRRECDRQDEEDGADGANGRAGGDHEQERKAETL